MKKSNTIALMTSVFMVSSINAATLDGTVMEDGKPLSNIKIVIPSVNQNVTTDDNGQFVFKDIEYGEYLVDIKGSNNNHFNIKVNFTEDNPVMIDLSSLGYEEIVVTANPLEHNVLKMTTPATVLTEEELVLNRKLSLDQTLNGIPGVNSGSFGAGSGQIVIRGQQGPRVSVLNNSITLQDAASVSPDHSITSEPLLAKQIEVLKGSATLLYGGGAIGGVVNVLDNIIPTQAIEGIQGGVEIRLSDSALEERAAVVSLEAGISDNLMTHFSYFNTETADYEIPGFAESEILHESEGHDDEEHEEEGHEEEEEAFGLLENTSVESDGYNLGFSLLNDNGFWGISYSDFSRNYGIPGHGHHEEEHDEEHEDEHGGEKEEEEEIVRIDMEKSVFNIKGQHQFNNDGFFKLLKAHYSDTDYQHVELEGDEIGTLFTNDANELRFELTHGHLGGFSGVWGLQSSNRDFAAVGDEAFILPSETQILSVFLIEEKDFDNWHAEFGLRYDNQSISTELYNDIDDNALSLSLGATFELNDNWILPINIASAQRLPTAEELFSNQSGADELIAHLATNTIEIGNPDLDHETANNIDIGIKYRNNGFGFNLSAFHNKINDYIFLENTGEEIDELPILNYAQQDATFKGFETDISYQHNSENGFIWNYQVFADSTKASLSNGENVPRIPARRIGFDVGMLYGNWGINMDYVSVSDQNTIAELELPTDGYDALGLNINRVIEHNNFETLLFLNVDNLLDEEIREHASFIKDIAPRPGRSMTAGIRFTF
ncbi:MAG: TonB-dependent receptor [Marinicellaceae bacterium]